MTLISCKFGMPGRLAPAFLFTLAAGTLGNTPLAAQSHGTIQPPVSARPVPDQLEMTKMIWSTLLAVDHANRSGNYSVLRDMSAQGFQINNDPARLSQIFASLRETRIDLSNALLIAPTFLEAPRQIQQDVFEVKGVFQLRPSAIQFDLYYQWEQGRWKLFGIDIQPITMATAPPGPVATTSSSTRPTPRKR
ncbi:hypothetical protein [Tsuneonella rigui]|uniref:hypothetical protein n=1 Tax=Tsuneonella rigui TaxID=1708790 RepID=UPI0019D0F1A4|nr:hypothetical protein [Tsuneonella rigui]